MDVSRQLVDHEVRSFQLRLRQHREPEAGQHRRTILMVQSVVADQVSDEAPRREFFQHVVVEERLFAGRIDRRTAGTEQQPRQKELRQET